jgi:hypothetical protein
MFQENWSLTHVNHLSFGYLIQNDIFVKIIFK